MGVHQFYQKNYTQKGISFMDNDNNQNNSYNGGNGGGGMENRIAALEKSVEKLESSVGSLERKVDNLDHKVENLEQKMDNLEQKMDKVEDAFIAFKNWVSVTLLACTTIIIAVLTLYTGWVIHDSNRNYEMSQKALDRVDQTLLRLERMDAERQK